MINADALQSARSKLRKAEDSAAQSQERSCAVTDPDQRNIRAVTGVQTDEQRVAYYLNGGVDAWHDELKTNLERNSQSSIATVTFPTSLVSLTRAEKLVLHGLFKDIFGDVVSVEDASQAAKQAIATEGGYFDLLEKKIADMRSRLGESDSDLSALCQRLDRCIQEQHGGSAFVKLTTRSPKDSYWAFCRARLSMRESDIARSDAVQHVDHNLRWAAFAERLRFEQRMTSGADALLLLATSTRVFEDLSMDLFEQPAGADQIQLSVRDFDAEVTPQTEFRGFVWNKEFVCCGQYFHQLYFPGLIGGGSGTGLLDRISSDLREFYERILKPNLTEFLKRTPCFMMDLVWTEERVLLTEINPFDGEAVGVFPASTGLFSWDTDETHGD